MEIGGWIHCVYFIQRGDVYFVLFLEDNSVLHYIIEISRMENSTFQIETFTSIDRCIAQNSCIHKTNLCVRKTGSVELF